MTIMPLLAILTLVTLKIVNILNWIRDHILEIQDDLKELNDINNDIYTQGLIVTSSLPKWGTIQTETTSTISNSRQKHSV